MALHLDRKKLQFDRFFGITVNEIVPLMREVMDRGTLIRAQYGFRTPDAIAVPR